MCQIFFENIKVIGKRWQISLQPQVGENVSNGSEFRSHQRLMDGYKKMDIKNQKIDGYIKKKTPLLSL